MKTFKAQLLAATIVAGGVPTVAQAQFAYPAAELDGVGATSIQTILVQTLNCYGNPGDHSVGNTDKLNKLGTNTGTTSTVPEGDYEPASPTASNPAFNCDTRQVQPNFSGYYVATGSGTGRAFWRTFANQLPGTTSSNINPFGTWNNVQFAFSDAPISAGDLTAYDANANNSTNHAGAPIQFPLYVLPVALAYNPVYGRLKTANGTQDLTFNVNPNFISKDSSGNPTGGLRMSRNLYCRIFNGYVVNFNNPAFKTTGVSGSLRDPADDSSRWTNVGVPIRLVGRLDSSGTTDIFTRHLAAACTNEAGVTVNRFQKNSEALPFDNQSGLDLRSFRSDTRYYTGRPAADFAGTVQSLSGAVFIKAASGSPARIDTTQGVEQPGLFMVADGSSGVRDAINYQLDPAGADGSVELNGKFGYIGGDFVKPARGAMLFSAALQVGTSTRYASATPAQALTAFGSRLPPETTTTSGAYDPSDTRTGPARDGTGGTVPIDRANPLHWTSVLYSDPSNTLATPNVGYPITGTTQFLGYTCYSTNAKRAAMTGFLSFNTGAVTRDYTGTTTASAVSPATVKGFGSTAQGLIAQLNIGPLPQSWLNAVTDTFLRRSANTALAAKNLWIQDRLPTKALGNSNSNSQCTAGEGA